MEFEISASMSSQIGSDTSGNSPRPKSKFTPIIFTNASIQSAVDQQREQQAQLSEGRENLKSWLGHMVRVTLQNKLTLVGIFSCTDRDQNLVIANCETDDLEPMPYGTVMVPGNQIVSFEVDMPEDREDQHAKPGEDPEQKENDSK